MYILRICSLVITRSRFRVPLLADPPCLGGCHRDTENPSTPELLPELNGAVAPGQTSSPLQVPCSDQKIPPASNPFIGFAPEDVRYFDFTRSAGKLRSMIYGRDDWLAPKDNAASTSIPSFDQIEDQKDLALLFAPYAPLIPVELHGPVINRLGRHDGMVDGGSAPMLATGLRRVVPHGKSKLRKLASEALAHRHCLDRFHAGDTGICRITWCDMIKLDDCSCQSVTIGHLHFRAVDFGDPIFLDEFLQRMRVSSDRLGRMEFCLMALQLLCFRRVAVPFRMPFMSASRSGMSPHHLSWPKEPLSLSIRRQL